MVEGTSASEERLELRRALEECLQGIEGDGSFVANNTLGEINPGLEVGDLGVIGMPISRHDAQRMMEYSTKHHDSSPKAVLAGEICRVSANHLQFRHPQWASHLSAALAMACEKLGVPQGSSQVQAELFQLTVLGKGPVPNGHDRESGKQARFGTMAITLPSVHTGGDIRMEGNGRKEVLETAPGSQWTCSMLAWYQDLLQQTEEVTSGYRVMLQYDLVHTGLGPRPSIDGLQNDFDRLKNLMDDWGCSTSDDSGMPKHLVYLLNGSYGHKSIYSCAPLNLKDLKGLDMRRARCIANAAAATNFVCFLADVEKDITGDCLEDDWLPLTKLHKSHKLHRDYGPSGQDDGYDGEDKPESSDDDSNGEESEDEIDDRDQVHAVTKFTMEKLRLRNICSLDGIGLCEKAEISEDDIIQDKPYTDRYPDGEHFNSNMWDEPTQETTHQFRNTALVLMPRKHCIAFFINLLKRLSHTDRLYGSRKGEVHRVIQWYTGRLSAAPNDGQCREDLRILCNNVLEGTQAPHSLKLAMG